MTIPTTPSFSRSGRSGPGGKNVERVSADVSEALLCDLKAPGAVPDSDLQGAAK